MTKAIVEITRPLGIAVHDRIIVEKPACEFEGNGADPSWSP